MKKRLAAALFAFAVFLPSQPVCAQPVGASSSSVEWLAATSPLIVRAVIEDVTPHEKRDGIQSFQTVSARVLETIKGEPRDRLQFVQSGDFQGTRIAGLQADKQEVLLFLNDSLRSNKFQGTAAHHAYTRFPFVVERVAVLIPDHVYYAESSIAPMTADLMVLSTPEELIEAMKSYLKHHRDDKPLRQLTIELPERLRGGYYKVLFTFPSDADPKHRDVPEPVIDFSAFKKRFAADPPEETKPPYTRDKSGYVGVYALDLMAADCDVIVRGLVEDSCFVAASDDPTGPACGIRLRVTETLKGKAAEHINFFVTDARDLEQLQRDRQEIVVFLRNQLLSGPAATLGHQTRAGLWDDSVVVLHRDSAEALFSDLTWDNDPDEILKRLRGIAFTKSAPLVFEVHPPESIADGSSLAGNEYAVIYLPVDRDLETNARKWATADNKDLRFLAARTMIYFKSAENAALLQTLLDDHATWPRKEMLRLLGPMAPVNENRHPRYLVRWEAWHVLDGWGFDVPMPEFR